MYYTTSAGPVDRELLIYIYIYIYTHIFSRWLPLGVFGAPLASCGATLNPLGATLGALGLPLGAIVLPLRWAPFGRPLAVLGHPAWEKYL